ncbi:hypothetical protein AAFF_G00279480 [Aldrovandia affinis]|uniref:C2H2-type domain-containing protein n=1 Tax=Aldrovandia affinis TaxID=143900 RepID=A0AAD7SR91_9TELE|nr:hypothetical protein AAFF_G00279480 [Aldrovandia affinis]
MAEEEIDFNSERFKEELVSLLDCRVGSDCDLQSKDYCSRFCELVEEYSARWQVPLPRLHVLRTALCCFAQSAASLPSDCEHVQYALSSLALSFFELLLFFGRDEFLEDPLKDILESFQDSHSCLERHANPYMNPYMLQVKRIIKDGGPWESPVLQAILRESAQSQEEVERYLNSEVPVFFEFRVRYLLACERVREAMALANTCIEHPQVGRQLYFHQAYLTCLWKASLYDRLHKEVAEIDGRHAVEIICNTESEERDDLLLALCRAFLSQQLQNGDMYYMWELVFIWSKLHLRGNPSKQDFLEECHQLMLSAKNVKSIFPFMKVIRAEVLLCSMELGNEGLQFCVELCARALQMDLGHDPATSALVYKTIAYLLPDDLEVCRACALLVFFLERSLESFRTAYLLYTHPDQEYQVDRGPIKNHIRFEILQILKKGLFFDPEFWNLLTLRMNCLKLMSEKVMQAALAEITDEDRPTPSHGAKDPCKVHNVERRVQRKTRPPTKYVGKLLVRRIVVPPEGAVDSLVKRRGRKPGSRVLTVVSGDDSLLRRSFRQLSMSQENSIIQQCGDKQPRVLAEQVEKKTLKRRGRKPRWLLQEAAAQVENSAPRCSVHTRKKTYLSPKDRRLYERDTLRICKEKDRALEGRDAPAPDLALAGITGGGEVLSLLGIPPPGDPPVTAIQGAMLEVSFPDNEVMDSMEQEEEMSGLHQAPVVQPDKGQARVLDVCRRGTFSEPCDNPPGESNGLSVPPVVRAMASEEHSIEVDREIIGYLHSYSKIHKEPVEGAAQYSTPVAKELPPAEQVRRSTSPEPGRESSGRPCEVTSTQPPDGTEKQALTSATLCINDIESGRTTAELSAIASIKLERSVLKLHCSLCNKDFKGGNVMRHALAHLQRDKLKCMFCGQLFDCQLAAKSHVADHIEKRKEEASPKDRAVHGNGASETLDRVTTSFSPKGKHKRKLGNDVENGVPLNIRLIHELNNLNGPGQVSGLLKDKPDVQKANGSIVRGRSRSGKEEEFGPAGGCTFVRMGNVRSWSDHKHRADSGASDQLLASGHTEDEAAGLTASTCGESELASAQEGDGEAREVEPSDDAMKLGADAHRQDPVVPGQAEPREKEPSTYRGPISRPFLRLPPSAYLDERYISMPKRRKPSAGGRCAPAGPESGGSQRQRCSSCFACFSCTDELQRHLSLNKCASLFGFDSDDEGKSSDRA